MSRTFYLACPETKLRLWVGQGTGSVEHPRMTTLYCDEGADRTLCAFLSMHAHKLLLFLDLEDPLFDQNDYIDFQGASFL